MECLSNRFDMAKLIEATIIKGSKTISTSYFSRENGC
jgi:hypothetical protein